jgi:membrane-associated phospholipid phosphatase
VRSYSPIALCSISACAAAAFIAVARGVASQQTARDDERFRETLQKRRRSVGDVVSRATNPLGKAWFHLPGAVALGLSLAQRGHGRAAFAPAAASAAAEVVGRVLDRMPPHRRPPAGHPKPFKPSFPSGHALETTAVAGASAYVLARENVADARVVFGAAAAVSLASTMGRLYLDRHWASDAIAGAALGVSIAAACAALYELSRSGAVVSPVGWRTGGFTLAAKLQPGYELHESRRLEASCLRQTNYTRTGD